MGVEVPDDVPPPSPMDGLSNHSQYYHTVMTRSSRVSPTRNP